MTQTLSNTEPTGCRVAAEDLSRRFGSHQALADVSLAIEPGETFGLLGANGAGKTTFIRLVTGYLFPSSGSVRVDGLSPIDDAKSVHARMGFVAETAQLYPDLRVHSFLRFAGGARSLAGSKLENAIEAAVENFRLDTVVDRLIGNLSKGYQQRVCLAQASLHDPALLIVDEPTGGLDPVQQLEVREVLGRARGRRTILLCTHDLVEARQLTNRIAVLNAGRLVALGETESVLGGDDPMALFRPRPEPDA